MKQNQNNQQSRKAAGRKLWVSFLAASLFLAMGCKKSLTPGDASGENVSGTVAAKAARAPVMVVQAGSSIQAAIDAAAAGTVIKIQPGTYKEAITVNKADITIMGEGDVTIQNPGTEAIGINVQDGADGFTLQHVTIRDFTERGVNMNDVDGFLFSHVTVISNGEFGLFSEYCRNGVFEHCEGSGHAETGIFVGQSTHVRILQNRMYANVIGLEVENSSFITIDKNHTYNNAVGILSLLVPGRITTQSSDITITKNQVHENNHVNFSEPPEQESILPSGTGILVLGVDNALVEDNHVRDNRFTGIAVISTNIFGLLGLPITGIEPNPDGTRVIGNKLKNNGYDPQTSLPFPVPGVDLLWLPELGPGTDNCWSQNLYATSYPASLPVCQ
jgi:parallel beta-helix repeat protein